jgi:ComF family protein
MTGILAWRGLGPSREALREVGRVATRAALDALYPPVCAACGADADNPAALCGPCFRDAGFIAGPVCDRCGLPTPAQVCDDCRADPPEWRRGRAAALYQGAARKAALALKHGDRHDVAQAAAIWMLRAGDRLVAQADWIAPVPLHRWRLLERGFNQAAELTHALCRRAGRPGVAAPDMLIRRRATPSQDGRTRAGRAANVAGAFAPRPGWRTRVEGATVLLVDDVMTTGATLSACAATLYAAGAAHVDALALARVARGGYVRDQR